MTNKTDAGDSMTAPVASGSDEALIADRRRFLHSASTLALTGGGLALLSACSSGGGDPAPTPTPSPTATGTASPTPSPTGTPTPTVTAADYLNFALNLEFLLAQYFSFAATGAGLATTLTDGAGTVGAVTGGAAVTFADTPLQQIARELAADGVLHVTLLRGLLNTQRAAMPAINIAGDATGAFTILARQAGIVGPADTFNPYASENNFLLGAFALLDVVVSAYRGIIPLFAPLTVAAIRTFVESLSGVLAAHCYQAATIRGLLYARGVATPSLRTQAQMISDARDALDGTSNIDQGIVEDALTANIMPGDTNGLVYARTTGQVLNILYLTSTSVAQGGFYPSGMSGNIKTSAAS